MLVADMYVLNDVFRAPETTSQYVPDPDPNIKTKPKMTMTLQGCSNIFKACQRKYREWVQSTTNLIKVKIQKIACTVKFVRSKKKVESGPGSEEIIPDLTSSKSSRLDQIRILNIVLVIMHFCM